MSTQANFDEEKSATPLSSNFKRRFAAWSLAIVGALSTNGVVCLQPSPAWSFDEPATLDDAKAKTESGEAEAFTQADFGKLLASGKIEDAAVRLDAELAKSPDDLTLMRMECQLASMLVRSNPESSATRVAAISQKLLARESLDSQAAGVLIQSTMLRVQLNRNAKNEDRLKILDECLKKLQETGAVSELAAIKALVQTKVQILIAANKQDEARVLMDPMLEKARSEFDPANPASVSAYSGIVATYHSSLASHFPKDVSAIVDQADEMLKRNMNREHAVATDYSAYVSLKLALANSLLYSDPKKCAVMVADIEEAIDLAKDRLGQDDKRLLASLELGLKTLKPRVKSAMEREELIGSLAPEIDAEHFVATDPVSMHDLRGKVVLLDFWAVWCGPCIATFPHLIEWHEKYSEKGLVILGATNFYSYSWDDQAGKAVPAKKGMEVNAQEELAMLEKFRESYQLHHGFFVSPKGSKYSKAFAVSGIPQAVLLDKQGKIQLIRVGSGEANSKAIESKIEELLSQ